MRVTFTLEPRGRSCVFPIHYPRFLQAAFYNLLTPEVAEFVHDDGFPAGGRRLRLFAFSRLLGDHRLRRQTKEIEFAGRVQLVVSSPVETVVRDLANAILRHESLRVGSEILALKQVALAEPVVSGPRLTVKTLSPITVYSTMHKAEGTPYTVFFHPREEEFGRLVGLNLARKYAAYHGKDSPFPPDAVRTRPLGRVQQNIVLYKGGVIKGYSGRFAVEGPPELLQMGLDAGLGGKNSQGFGLVEVEGGVAEGQVDLAAKY